MIRGWWSRRAVVLAFCAVSFARFGHGAGTVGQDGGTLALGGSVTEIIFALGAEHRLIARDATSIFPQEARALPDMGCLRTLSPEGVLSINPALILCENVPDRPRRLRF